jgi:hypothetical protein
MPIIEFTGVEAERDVIIDLIRQIKIWVASVESLEIGVKNVTPMFVSSIQENSGEHVVFYVQELFTVSFAGKIRTSKTRKELAQAIEINFSAFIATGKLTVKPKSVTIVTRMVDREKWEYYGWDIQSK